jgi:predicted O-linked N-acetylglucosamine transferase (SPINDLY family)
VVSGDLRDHSVGHFVEGLLPELAASGVELIGYPTGDEVTPLTLRIKPYFAAWRSLSGLSDEAAAARIHADGVHVLLDLSGHTAYSRLTLFAWKPAPVQASWLGYCATTGLAEMDWYIADGVTLPAALEGFFTEKIWRLPENYLCFSRPQETVAVSELPARRRGGLTFGSFNNLSKMTDEAVALWSRLLEAVPGSRLLLKTMQMRDETVRERVRARYAAQGIGDDRLVLQGPVEGRGGHLAVYGEVDIGLDPFPYNGVTTTMEALWMGVPVLTLAGQRFLARQGMGIMSGAGLGDWVAADGDALIARAQYWAAHLDELAALRAGMRERLLASPLLDAPRFARHFAAALHGMWQQRPAGLA